MMPAGRNAKSGRIKQVGSLDRLRSGVANLFEISEAGILRDEMFRIAFDREASPPNALQSGARPAHGSLQSTAYRMPEG